MSSDFGAWVSFYLKFMFDILYTVNMPGINIPILYFLILISIVTILISILKRTLFEPTHNNKNSKGSKNSSKGKKGG